ncbi:MAG TPA: 3-octaprenyl-4-hydroxybenzoate carboxy-lyase [Bacteroidales bacterium]|nr:3-octaprenyl-4-hydroxybenzoate carboxy-lyase [Bacteroidales bacterium]
MENKLVISVTGASGSIYALQLFNKLMQPNLREQWSKIGVVFSKNALDVWQHELGEFRSTDWEFNFYDRTDYRAPFASGSAKYNIMLIVPCSMGTLGRIAGGISDDLTTRAADVMLKERRKLLLVTRDTPLNLIHINNMKTVTEAGGIIVPASPSFYSRPTTVEAVADTVVDRILDLAGFEIQTNRWNE